MTDRTYNGWTNYETWCWNLWMDNEQGVQDYWREEALELLRNNDGDPEECYQQFSERLESECEENCPISEGAYFDLVRAAISEINFYEIAKSIIDSTLEENAEEFEEEEALTLPADIDAPALELPPAPKGWTEIEGAAPMVTLRRDPSHGGEYQIHPSYDFDMEGAEMAAVSHHWYFAGEGRFYVRPGSEDEFRVGIAALGVAVVDG